MKGFLLLFLVESRTEAVVVAVVAAAVVVVVAVVAVKDFFPGPGKMKSTI